MPAVTPLVPHRNHIAVLQYLCDDQARRRPALGHIFVALRSDLGRLAEIISTTASEVVTYFLPVPSPLLDFDGVCRGAKASEDEQLQIDHELRILNLDRAFSPYGKHDPFTELPSLKPPQKQKDIDRRFSRCLECATEFVDEQGRPTPSAFEFCGESERVTGPCKKEWLKKHPPACESRRVEPKFGDALSLADYAARYQDDVEVTVKRKMLPGLRNGRPVRVREAWEIEAYNADWTAKNNRKLAARGWIGYSPEAFDREIIRERKQRGAVELEAMAKFDRDLSRKGNKYRIQ
jgi:hypothetical protein